MICYFKYEIHHLKTKYICIVYLLCILKTNLSLSKLKILEHVRNGRSWNFVKIIIKQKESLLTQKVLVF